MDLFLITLGVLLLFAGLIGCVVPFLPGPPLAYVSLLLLQFSSKMPFNTDFMWMWAGIVALVTVLDYWVPIVGTRKFGGTKAGTRGALLGLLIGLFVFPPIGLIVGPFVGALLGELLAGQPSEQAFNSALGSFAGFLAGILMKLAVTVVIGYYFYTAL